MAKQDPKETTTEVATVIDENTLAGLSADDRLNALMTGGNVTAGGSQTRVVEKAQLVGVPMLVEEVIYRLGSGEWSPGVRYDYVTFKVIILTEDYLSQLGVNSETFNGVKPGESVIFNDGSTGIGRQMTARLHRAGVIGVDADQGGKMDETGGKGKSAFDQPRELWEFGAEEASKGIKLGVGNAPAILLAKGLRASEYNGPNGAAKTYYEG